MFPIVDRKVADKLREKFVYEEWVKLNEDRIAIRFVTSWATTDKAIDELEKVLKSL